MTDLAELLAPKYIEVTGAFYPRGGISIKPFANFATEDYLEFAARRQLDYLR